MAYETINAENAAIERRIAVAQSQRDAWRAAGQQEKYLEACSMVDALELQLERRLCDMRPAAGG